MVDSIREMRIGMAFPLSAPNMYIHICIVISYVISSPAEAKATGPASSVMLYVVFGSPIVTFITTCQFICSLRISSVRKGVNGISCLFSL